MSGRSSESAGACEMGQRERICGGARRRARTHFAWVVRPAPCVRVEELSAEEPDVEVVDARELAQDELHQHPPQLVMGDKRAHALRVVRPAVVLYAAI